PGYLGAESFTVNALSLELLPQAQGGAIDIDLASSTVRAADQAVEAPTLEADPGSLRAGEPTTVTGTNYPPNTSVDVQLTDADGAPVGDPVTVTTDDAGAFITELVVPEGTADGDYTVVGTASSGEAAEADLVVLPASAEVNTA